MNALNQWWSERAQREQWILIAAAVVIALAIIIKGLVTPILEKRQRLDQQIAEASEQLAWMRAASQAIQSRSPAQAGANTRSPQASLTNLGRRFNLSISRLEPLGDRRLEAWINEAPYTQALRLLEAAQNEGLQILAVDLKQADEPGVVQMRLRVGS